MQKKKGISLIVLVITIIVMVILAGAIILTLNNSGIIQKASSAVEETNLATVKEVASLAWAEAYADGVRTQVDLEKAVLDSLTEAKVNTTQYTITVTENGVDVELKRKGNVIGMVDGVPIPKGFVASPYEGENTKASGLVIYELNEGEEVFLNNETQFDSWTTRNQYVWIPVMAEEFTTEFVRGSYNNTSYSNVLGTSNEYWEVELDDLNMPKSIQSDMTYMSQNTLSEVQAMYASVKKYGGFYVARYEAGLDEQRTDSDFENDVIITGSKVHSKMNQIPYVNLLWADEALMNSENGGILEIARSIYPKSNVSHGVVSTLIYGVQWDMIMKWWLDTEAVGSVTNSVAYGNYKNHVISAGDLNEGAKYTEDYEGTYEECASNFSKDSKTMYCLSTGALKAAKVNNIYDMAGNVNEWTMESYSTKSRVYRGGTFMHNGASWDSSPFPVSKRSASTISTTTIAGATGIRIALYIK